MTALTALAGVFLAPSIACAFVVVDRHAPRGHGDGGVLLAGDDVHGGRVGRDGGWRGRSSSGAGRCGVSPLPGAAGAGRAARPAGHRDGSSQLPVRARWSRSHRKMIETVPSNPVSAQGIRRNVQSWTAAFSGWRTSTASRVRSGDSAACLLTRWRGTSSAVSCHGAAAAMSFCGTAPASISTSGSHPEYATPECDNVTELVTHDKAGERILEGLLVDAERRLHEEGIAGDVYLFKNNTDSAGNSYGCHENYLVARHGEFSRLADILIPFLVTRQLLCGAGKVLQTPRGAVYCVSQRAEHIWEGVSPPRRPVPGRSSTPATNRTRTPSATAGCTSSSATRTCPRRRCCSRSAPPTSCCA